METTRKGRERGQLAHRHDLLKDSDNWEYGYHGKAKAHVGISRLRAWLGAGAMSVPCACAAETVPSSRARQRCRIAESVDATTTRRCPLQVQAHVCDGEKDNSSTIA